MTETVRQQGRELAERLGLEILGTEGHDLKVACVACPSSDAGRVHSETGVYHCYRCGKSLNAFDLCKVRLGDQQAAIQAMVHVGLFEPSVRNGKQNGKPAGNADILEEIAQAKGVTADAFRAYGAAVQRNAVVFPMYGPDADECSTFILTRQNTKGLYAKGKPAGLFFPGRFPVPGESWCIVEGVKDAAALHSLGFLAAGLPTNRMAPQFAPLFGSVDATIVPDCDLAGVQGAEQTARVLHPLAKRVRLAKLPMEFKNTKGADVRDCLKHYRDQGPAVVRKAIAEAVTLGADGKPAESPRFAELIDSPGLLALDLKPEWLVRGVVAKGKPLVIGGRSKTLKTSIAVDLVLSLGTGTDFLGKFPARLTRVGLWSGESGPDTLRETAMRIAASKGVDLVDAAVWWNFSLPKLARPDHLDVLADIIDQHKLELLLLDPLYLSLIEAGDSGRASDLFTMGTRLEPIGKLGQERNCTIVVCHHFRKTGPTNEDEPAGLEELSQSGVCEWCRGWILLSRRRPYQGDGRHDLWMRTGGSSGHAGFWAADIDEGVLDLDTMGGRKWEVDVRPVTEAREEARQEQERKKADDLERREGEHRDRVLTALSAQTDWTTARRLRVLTRLNADNLERAIITLEKEGRIEAGETHTKGGKAIGYRARK